MKKTFLIGAALMLSITACNSKSNSNDANIQNNADPVTETKSTSNDEPVTGINVGDKFTDFKLSTPDGGEKSLSELVEGHKLTLVDFWASWCGPCRMEMPNVVKAYSEYKDKGLQIVGVSFDENMTSWKDAISKLKMTWPQLSDLKGWDCAAGRIYEINSIPSTMLIDENGKIIAKDLRGEELIQKIGEILK